MTLRILEKIRSSIREDGYATTVRKATRAVPARLATYCRRAKFKSDFLVLETPEDRFTRIYERNYWKGSDSTSGTGSSIEYTANLRSQLPRLFARFSIKSIVDAPCGDFNWMRDVVSNTSVDYTGGDIVKPLTQQLKEIYTSDAVRFLHLDITKDPLPHADLMICRDCLFQSVLCRYESCTSEFRILRHPLPADYHAHQRGRIPKPRYRDGRLPAN